MYLFFINLASNAFITVYMEVREMKESDIGTYINKLKTKNIYVYV